MGNAIIKEVNRSPKDMELNPKVEAMLVATWVADNVGFMETGVESAAWATDTVGSNVVGVVGSKVGDNAGVGAVVVAGRPLLWRRESSVVSSPNWSSAVNPVVKDPSKSSVKRS